MTLEETKQALEGGEWISIANEVRPSKNADGSIRSFYLKRNFKYHKGDTFVLDVTSSAEAYGKVPLASMHIEGRMIWQGEHAIAPGAQKVDFIADGAYEVTPLHQGFADAMNTAAKNYNTWQVNVPQSIFKKQFVPFGLAEGQVFAEFDLVYIFNNLLFWGARNVDGRGFDTEENRPANLQIPLVRK